MAEEKPLQWKAPIYAMAYAALVPVARFHGYALAVHGSLGRDADFVAVPWIELCSDPETLVDACAEELDWAKRDDHGAPGLKPHGRLAFNIIDPRSGLFIDLAVMPKAVQP